MGRFRKGLHPIHEHAKVGRGTSINTAGHDLERVGESEETSGHDSARGLLAMAIRIPSGTAA